MGGTTQVNGPCAVSWAAPLAHSTVRHGTASTTARRGTSQCRASMARPCRVLGRHGTAAIYINKAHINIFCRAPVHCKQFFYTFVKFIKIIKNFKKSEN
jgi:hypothetical protein